MSYTLQDLFNRACALVDSLKVDGTVDASTTADYKARTILLTDLAIKDLSIVADYFKNIEYSRNPVENLLGDGFSVQAHEDDDLEFETTTPAKSYYFESDSNGGTAYIEDYTSAWNTLATVTLTNTGQGYISYSGALTPTTGATKTRIRFSGSYHYNTVNRALYEFSFETGKIPVYQPYVKITLPTDINVIDKVILEGEENDYTTDPVYKTENVGTAQYLYVDYNFKGKIRVQYKPNVNAPTALTDSVVIDDFTAMAVCYFLAMNFVATEQNESLTSLFRSEYESRKASANKKQPKGFVKIVDYYGGV